MRWFGLVLAAFALMPIPLRGSALEVDVEVVPWGDASSPVVEGMLVWQPASDDEARMVAFRGEGRHALPDLGRGLGTLSVEAAGYWAAETVVSADSLATTVVLYPTGRLEGELVVPKGAEVPTALDLEFGPASFLQMQASTPVARVAGSVRCPVGDGERFHCDLPLGRHDLRWHAPGFATVLRWDVEVEPRSTTQLSSLRLVAGGSILGFVAVAGDAPPREGERRLQVLLEIPSGEGADHDTRRRLAYLSQEAAPGPDGTFQFVGLPEGVYRIVATGEDLAPESVPLIEVLEGRESRLSEVIRLVPKVVQEVRIVRPTTPEGRPWRVRLMRSGTAPGHGLCTTDPVGSCRLDDLPVALYRLLVEDGPGTRWHVADVEVGRHPLPLLVELPLVEVQGTISRGGDPARARLIFHRKDGQRVEAYSDFEGRYTGWVPGEGSWQVSANLEAHGVEVGRRSRDGGGRPSRRRWCLHPRLRAPGHEPSRPRVGGVRKAGPPCPRHHLRRGSGDQLGANRSGRPLPGLGAGGRPLPRSGGVRPVGGNERRGVGGRGRGGAGGDPASGHARALGPRVDRRRPTPLRGSPHGHPRLAAGNEGRDLHDGDRHRRALRSGVAGGSRSRRRHDPRPGPDGEPRPGAGPRRGARRDPAAALGGAPWRSGIRRASPSATSSATVLPPCCSGP